MSIELTMTGRDDDGPYTDGPFYVCSSTSWAAFARWAATAPASVVPHVVALASTGRTADTFALSAELGALTDAGGMPNGVAATVGVLTDIVGMGQPDERASVSDGVNGFDGGQVSEGVHYEDTSGLSLQTVGEAVEAANKPSETPTVGVSEGDDDEEQADDADGPGVAEVLAAMLRAADDGDWDAVDALSVLLDEASEARDRSHLVKKVITNRLGRKQLVYVRPADHGAAAKPRGPSAAAVAAQRKAAAEPARVAARAAWAAAAGDPHGVHADDLPGLAEHLRSLTRDELRQVTKRLEAGLRTGGGLKDDLVDGLLHHVRADRKPQQEPTDGQGERSGRVGPDASGPGRDGKPDAVAGGPVAGAAGGPGDGGTGQGGEVGGQPDGIKSAGRVPADHEVVNRRLDRYAKLFRDRGNHEAAHWMGLVRDHVGRHGPAAVLASLGEDRGDGPGAQYEGGWTTMGDFAQSYLDRHGITLANTFAFDVDPDAPLVSSLSPSQGASGERGVKGDYLPQDPTLKDKLAEAKNLPGLETSEDINVLLGRKVTHLTPDVTAKLDATYGAGKWIVKAYGDDAAAGYGIFFPQRAEQIKRDAQNTIWSAGENLARYGFMLRRNKAGKVVGLEHSGGDRYDFGTPRYRETIDGDARHWADLAADAARHERGAQLPGGGKEFMAQPAFPVVGISDADRAAGMTIKPGQEGRVHVVTRNGRAELVPHSTWLKQEPLPVVFETDDTRAMAQAAVDAINALPESERKGQIYAPDIVKTADGYKVVEANPANHTGSSGYLGDNPFIIDAYVSHLTGRSPGHIQFVRSLLSKRAATTGGKGDGQGQGQGGQGADATGTAVGSGSQGGRSGGGGESGPDAGPTGRIDQAEPVHHDPAALSAGLMKHGVGRLPPIDDEMKWRWEHPPEVQERHNRAVMSAAQRGGFYVPPDRLPAAVRTAPNVGGQEHDVHEDAANNRFYKLTKGGHFGQNTDVHEYLKRHEVANRLWPELGYKLHGITQDHAGRPQVVLSMNRVEGTHPQQSEIHDWFTSNGWVSNEEEEDTENGTWSWRDPETGTVINDAHTKNFIKTAGGLVPIDVDIVPGVTTRRKPKPA